LLDHPPVSWRTALKRIIESGRSEQERTAERARIARAINVSPRTLDRYMSGESTPPAARRQLLLEAIPPNSRATFADLLHQEFPERTTPPPAVTPPPTEQELPSVFIMTLVRGACMTPDVLRPLSQEQLIFQQLTGRLDPHHTGTAFLLYQCQATPKQQVYALREIYQAGTGPWRDLPFRQQKPFVGIESLAGQAILSLQPEVARPTQLAALHLKGVQQAIAYPIQRAGRSAGVLVACSIHPDHFNSPRRRQDLLEYSWLIALTVFEPNDFYTQEQIALRQMPSYHYQERLLLLTDQVRARLMREAEQAGHPIPVQEAEEAIYQRLAQLEEGL
jgi:transcriptional regulator with XRE-family HTH domain